MLTPNQRDVIVFIIEQIRDQGRAPSYDEIGEHFGWRSKSTAFHVVGLLVERGFLRTYPRQPRAIEVLKRPPFRAEATVYIPVTNGPDGLTGCWTEQAVPIRL